MHYRNILYGPILLLKIKGFLAGEKERITERIM